MARTKKADVNVSLFRGLSREQTRLMVEADTIATSPHFNGTDEERIETVRRIYERVHRSLGPATSRRYAAICMASCLHHIACIWWRVVKDAGEANLYRETVIVTAGSVARAKQLLGKLTVDEYRILGQRFLKKGDLLDAFLAFAMAGPNADVRRVRCAAVKDGDIGLAERIANRLHDPLTDRERADLLANAIRYETSTDLSLIHRIKNAGESRQRLTQLFLEKRMKSGLQYPYLQMFAKRLGVGISVVQLEALFRRVTCAQSRQDEAIMIAEELIRRRIHGWEERLRRLYRSARAHCIECRSFRQADVYGRKYWMPLTLKELRNAARCFPASRDRRELWESHEWDWIHDRMAKLIAHRLRAKMA